MKSFKKLVGTLLGGIGAFTGIGMLMNACSEEDNNKPVVEVTIAQVEQCCGTDKTASEYPYCVNRYIYTGTCITSSNLSRCCGSKTSNDDYNACVKDYLQNGYCSKDGDEATPLYGMPDTIPTPTQEDIQECCGNDDGTSLYKQCIDQFDPLNDVIFCIGSDPNDDLPAIYGPIPERCCDNTSANDDTCNFIYDNTGVCPKDPGNEGLVDCCEGITDPEELNICVKDYVNYGSCLDIDDVPPDPVYGPDPGI